MARPSRIDREAAIETAMNAFWRDGFEANSVKAMSEKLGITRSSFYNAFGTREELFKASLGLYFQLSPDRALRGDIGDQSIKALLSRTFRDICRARMADAEARGCLVINSLAELCGPQSELGDYLSELITGNVDSLEELIVQAVQNGELPADTDTRAKALALQNLLIGINAFSKTLRDEEDLWQTAKTTLEGLDLYAEFDNS